jgi:hypothetical protein
MPTMLHGWWCLTSATAGAKRGLTQLTTAIASTLAIDTADLP